MTKGHRAAVKRAQKSIAVDAITGSRADIGDVFAAYQEMHRRAAGRTTRPQRTFDIMLEWLRNGDAVLFGATPVARVAGGG